MLNNNIRLEISGNANEAEIFEFQSMSEVSTGKTKNFTLM